MYLGIGKTLYNSSASFLSKDKSLIEIQLMERLLRKKACGLWPERALENLVRNYDLEISEIVENRDVILPSLKEKMMEERFPFYEYLKKKGLDKFCTNLNDKVEFISHHLAHAWSAVLMSPFEDCCIVVLDGAGTSVSDFPYGSEELTVNPAGTHEDLELCTVYRFKNGNLKFVKKYWQKFIESEKHDKQSFSTGVGIFYEKIAEFIFNSNQASGKVMGLASFGTPLPVENGYYDFLENLDWEKKAFKENSKDSWETSPNMNFYQDLAATAQYEYEKFLKSVLNDLKPDSENLVMVGGCALNCTANMKIYDWTEFREVYIPPFPGDGGIGLGCASYKYHQQNKWTPFEKDNQNGYFGPKTSTPGDSNVEKVFKDYELKKSNNIAVDCAKELFENKIVAWFQGRSESGPRALGNRSILARPDFPNLKDYLNSKIKFRESFRPYGCSVPLEDSRNYFNHSDSFETPYMSFAVEVNKDKREFLKEVLHVDNTSRMQTVRPGQNDIYYRLLKEYGKLSGNPVLLNTSLNIMGEPIVETLDDLEKFFQQSKVDILVAGNFIIKKKL
ncbi:MAG: hypothetical protein KC493_02540 [Bacteriovoracaceae bacterium]|nr:hypothetical protein [Bacteriovoracaceae bacterium]